MTDPADLSRLDAIVLAGGGGRRMGAPKAMLPFGDTSLAGAVVEALQPIFRRVLVVARDKASLAGLDAEILEDGWPLQGPLVGLARGLSHTDAPWCFLAACDMPFLQADEIREMAAHLADCDAVVPECQSRLQSLHAFYERRCLVIAEDVLDQGATSMKALLSRCRVTELPQEHFGDMQNGIQSFRDLDTSEEYRAALRAEAPPS